MSRKKSRMEASCYENGELGAITWAVLDALRRSGASAQEVGAVVELLNTHLPNLGPVASEEITQQCKDALRGIAH